jgi:hypothetical protein
MLDYSQIAFLGTQQMIQGIGHIHSQTLLLLRRVEDTPRMAAVCPILGDVSS